MENDDDDIYAVNDEDESDNEDVAMVTDPGSTSQETSLVAHVSGEYIHGNQYIISADMLQYPVKKK